LSDVLSVRLASLSPDAHRVVRAASVLGRRVDHQLLDRILPDASDEVLACLREAVEARILVTVDEGPTAAYVFRHALLGEAAYAELLPAERIALHAAAERALESDRGDDELPAELAGEIAYHAFHANDLPRSLAASLRAGEAATAVYAFPEAFRQ